MGPDIYYGTQIYFLSWDPNLFSDRQHLANGNSSEFLGQTDCVLLISLRHGVSSELSSDVLDGAMDRSVFAKRPMSP